MKIKFLLICIAILSVQCAPKKEIVTAKEQTPSVPAEDAANTYTPPKQAEKGSVDASKNSSNIKKQKLDCIDPSQAKPYVGCGNTKGQEVCGCNGVTYRNVCEAQREGVTSYKKGRCVTTEPF